MGLLFDALKSSRLTLLHGGGKNSVSHFDRAVREVRTVILYLCTNWRGTKLGKLPSRFGLTRSPLAFERRLKGIMHRELACPSSSLEGWLPAARNRVTSYDIRNHSRHRSVQVVEGLYREADKLTDSMLKGIGF